MGWLRIIAGELRGRRILVPHGVRPTSDRAREALFSILAGAIPGTRLLDAYAGSGALGFEALSRGAAEVVFVESDRLAAAALETTAQRLGVAGRSTVLRGPVVDLLRGGKTSGPFGVILADPPYAGGERQPFLEVAAGLMQRGGLLVLECDARAAIEACSALSHVRAASYGRCRLDFYRPLDAAPRESGPG